jgi:MoxR-like ATPase
MSTPSLQVSDSSLRPPLLERIEGAIRSRVVGQEAVVHRLLVALFAGGHVLLEGVPGLAKTLLARTLAQAVDASFRRIQFTPDLLPSDILGGMVFQEETRSFVAAPGPIFANFVLADEINRAPPKVQSALLEAMEEEQVSLGGDTYRLRQPFMVLATQNPLEHHGTYPLAEAQIDRFMMHLRLDYPGKSEEREILRLALGEKHGWLEPVVSPEDLLEARSSCRQVHVDARVQDYVVDLVHATRRPVEAGLAELAPLLSAGASPRAGIALQSGARARAFLEGRSYVLPDDVKALAPDVLRHRIHLNFEAQAQGLDVDELLARILSVIPVP